jgi:iron complex outermembrane receptor protein
MEFSARWFPSHAFNMDFNASWINSTYDDYVTPDGRDLRGEATGEPWFSYSAGANYQVDLAESGGLQFTLRHAYRGAGRCNSGSSTQGNCGRYMNFTVGEEQNRTDVFVQWRSPMDTWGVALYANNVFDNRYVHGLNQYGTTVFGTTGATITEPRFYGMELQYKF